MVRILVLNTAVGWKKDVEKWWEDDEDEEEEEMKTSERKKQEERIRWQRPDVMSEWVNRYSSLYLDFKDAHYSEGKFSPRKSNRIRRRRRRKKRNNEKVEEGERREIMRRWKKKWLRLQMRRTERRTDTRINHLFSQDFSLSLSLSLSLSSHRIETHFFTCIKYALVSMYTFSTLMMSLDCNRRMCEWEVQRVRWKGGKRVGWVSVSLLWIRRKILMKKYSKKEELLVHVSTKGRHVGCLTSYILLDTKERERERAKSALKVYTFQLLDSINKHYHQHQIESWTFHQEHYLLLQTWEESFFHSSSSFSSSCKWIQEKDEEKKNVGKSLRLSRDRMIRGRKVEERRAEPRNETFPSSTIPILLLFSIRRGGRESER